MISIVNMCGGILYDNVIHRVLADFFTLRVPTCRMTPDLSRLSYDIAVSDNMPQDEIWLMDKETGELKGKIINLNPL